MTIIKIAINRMQTGKLPQGDPRWASFNDAFENREMDRAELANAIYTGHAYTTWHNGRRKIDNFQLGQHVAIDMDTNDERSSIDVLRQHPLVKMYGGLIHTTPSHSPQAPRARVIFLLDQPITTALGYTAAAEFLLSQFPEADEACKDASRFFYGAMNCEIALSENLFPLAHLRHFYTKWKGTKAGPGRQFSSTKVVQMPVHVDGAKVEMNEDDLAKALAALDRIDPLSMDYNRWIGIIAAFKREHGDAAMGHVVRWAKGKPGEVEREWERLKVDRAKATTMGTVFFMAGAG